MAMIHMEPQTLQLFERVLGTLKPPPEPDTEPVGG